jgi:kynurenine formamidase
VRSGDLKDELSDAEVAAYWKFLLKEAVRALLKVPGIRSAKLSSRAGGLRVDLRSVLEMDDVGAYERLPAKPQLRALSDTGWTMLGSMNGGIEEAHKRRKTMVARRPLWVATVVALAWLLSVLPCPPLPVAAAGESWMPPLKEQRCPSKWGPDDERGAANLLTPAKVVEATKLMKEGKIYELGRVLEIGIPTFGIRRFGIYTARTTHIRGRNDNRSNEELVVTELGQVGTQFDGLAHITIGGLAYNCYDTMPTDRLLRTGFDRMGIEKVGTIFTRGVLVDIAGVKGVDMLEAGYEITVADLEAALRTQGVAITPGDAVLLRTGWGKLWMQDNAKYNGSTPGPGIAAADWLVERQPVLVGADTFPVEVFPNPDKDLFAPVHQIFLVVNGVYLLENLDVEGLARDRVYEFAFVMQPLKIKGGTGSTVAPSAIR